jgi:hypothetical protein
MYKEWKNYLTIIKTTYLYWLYLIL